MELTSPQIIPSFSLIVLPVCDALQASDWGPLVQGQAIQVVVQGGRREVVRKDARTVLLECHRGRMILLGQTYCSFLCPTHQGGQT